MRGIAGTRRSAIYKTFGGILAEAVRCIWAVPAAAEGRQQQISECANTTQTRLSAVQTQTPLLLASLVTARKSPNRGTFLRADNGSFFSWLFGCVRSCRDSHFRLCGLRHFLGLGHLASYRTRCRPGLYQASCYICLHHCLSIFVALPSLVTRVHFSFLAVAMAAKRKRQRHHRPPH